MLLLPIIPTNKKFRSDGFGSIQMTVLDDQNRPRDVTLTGVLYSSQLQYNLISTTKLAKKGVETFLRLPHQLSQLILGNDVIAVIKMINDQYVLRKNTNPRALIKLREPTPTIETWHARLKHLGYDNLIKLENPAIEMTLNKSRPD
jgi:hypothetical protein